MSLKKFTHLKIVPTFIKNSLKISQPFRTFLRRYATNSRMKIPIPDVFLERQKQTLASRATLSARPPFIHERYFGEEKREERPLPQHEPGHFALMPPLRPAKQLNLYHQQNILNGNRMPSYSDVDSDPEDCISALDKVRRMEESRKVHKKMLDLMQQQNELNQCLQDRQDETRGGGGGTRPGVSRWASSGEEQQPKEEKPAPSKKLEGAKAGEGTGTRLGSLDSATALVTAEMHGKPSMYSHRSLQMPPRLPMSQGYRPDEEQFHRHIQKAYMPRNMIWPDYAASTTQLYKNAVTPPKGKPIYSKRPEYSVDYDADNDSDSDTDSKESIKSVRPGKDGGNSAKHSIAMSNRRTQDILELHKARASELEKRAIEGLSKKSPTSRVVAQNESNRGKVFIKTYKLK